MADFPRFRAMPRKMAGLAIDHRGFPVPWFVAWQDGKPVFPAMDPRKLQRAIVRNLCWVCGGELGRIKAFVIGPMCAVNRTSAEPPCHLECARFSALNCPFLSKPAMGRVPIEHYGGTRENTPGVMLERNPGVTLIWQTRRYELFDDGAGGTLFDIGKPHSVEWYARGRRATRLEVLESIETGIPHLEALVEADPDRAGAQAELDRRLAAALELVPQA
jgi:hypothetical protein